MGQLSASEIAALQLPKGTELTTTLAPTAHAQKVVTSLPSGVANASKAVSNLSTSSLNPTHYITKSKTTMQTLLNDIRANGIQESIKYVENNGVKYIVDGHHRFYAAQRLRIQNVPVQQVQLPYGGYKNIMDLMMEPGKQPGFWNFLK
ncbi:MAG: ParB-like nuclease domain-containing protein [Saprospiraceae bacterium]|nr:ParB-like nuclease domain-containing protein [Saprospiraceae bacterium]